MSPTRRQRTTAEWVVFGIATAIVLAVAGAIALMWLQPSDPARVTVQPTGEQSIHGTQSYISAEVTNEGDETAEAIQVHAEMTVEGEVVAEGEQVVDFLSGGETQELVFVFEDVPPNAELELRVASFTVP